MITFKQYIIEALDSSYPVEYSANSPQYAYYSFKDADGNKFEVEMHRGNIVGRVMVEVAFGVRMDNGKTTSQPTGATKNALKVYSTVGNELRKYVKANPVEMITFSAASPRTYTIYGNLAKKIARELNGTIKKPYMREGSWEIHL